MSEGTLGGDKPDIILSVAVTMARTGGFEGDGETLKHGAESVRIHGNSA